MIISVHFSFIYYNYYPHIGDSCVLTTICIQ